MLDKVNILIHNFIKNGDLVMVRINDSFRIAAYVREYEMDKIFSQDMTSYFELLSFRKNEYILREGDEMPYLFFLVEGKAKVFTSLSNGKSLLLCFYQGFKVLGELEAVNGVKAVTNVQAIADTLCIGIPYVIVRKKLMEDPVFLRYICSSLGGKLNRCSKNSSINLLFPLENRLASYIYTTGERIYDKKKKNIKENVKDKDNSNKPSIYFHENLTEIAELLGTSYRHLLRTFSDLCEQKVLKKHGSSYLVINEKVLIELSADLYK